VIGSHIFYRRPGGGGVEAFSQAPASAEPRTGYASAGVRNGRGQGSRSSGDSQQPRVQVATVQRETIQRATIQRATIERPTIERPVFQRAAGSRTSRAVRTSTLSPQLQSQTRAQPAPVRRGPRTTIESGVRVARGS
jgi:hypothetical protein